MGSDREISVIGSLVTIVHRISNVLVLVHNGINETVPVHTFLRT